MNWLLVTLIIMCVWLFLMTVAYIGAGKRHKRLLCRLDNLLAQLTANAMRKAGHVGQGGAPAYRQAATWLADVLSKE